MVDESGWAVQLPSERRRDWYRGPRAGLYIHIEVRWSHVGSVESRDWPEIFHVALV